MACKLCLKNKFSAKKKSCGYRALIIFYYRFSSKKDCGTSPVSYNGSMGALITYQFTSIDWMERLARRIYEVNIFN